MQYGYCEYLQKMNNLKVINRVIRIALIHVYIRLKINADLPPSLLYIILYIL